MLEPYATLFQYEAWADTALLEAIAGHPETAADETVRKRLRHTHVVQRVFLAYLEGGKPDLAATRKPFESIEAHGTSVREYQVRVMQALEGIDEEGSQRKSALEWFEGVEVTIAEMMLQMTMHSHHHLGQNMLRMRQLGGEPPTLDFIVWVAQGRPAPAG